MSEILHLHTVFEDPILPPPDILPGRNILLIGLSSKGKQWDIVSVSSPEEMGEFYGSGPLVNAYNEAYNAGAYAVYVCRINEDSEEDISDEEMYSRLERVYDYASGFPVHIVCPVGVYLDNSTYSFAEQLLNFCIQKKDDIGSIGVIGVSPCDPGDLDSHIDKLMDLNFLKEYEEDFEGDYSVNNRGLLAVVVDHAEFYGDEEDYINSAAHSFAGLISSLEPRVSPTNKRIRGIRNLIYDYGERQEIVETITLSSGSAYLSRIPMGSIRIADPGNEITYIEGDNGDYTVDRDTGKISLSDNSSLPDNSTIEVTYTYDNKHSLAKRGLNTLRESVQRGYVPYKAVTVSHPESPYHQLSSTRVVLEILELLYDADMDAIGNLSHRLVLESYHKFIQSVLDSKMDDGSITAYNVNLKVIPETMTLIASISLQVLGEIKSVGTVVRFEI